MLTCREVVARSSALLEGELGFRERLAVRLHLAMCKHCRRFLRQLTLLVESLRRRSGVHAAPVPAEFVERVMRALETAEPRSDTKDPADR